MRSRLPKPKRVIAYMRIFIKYWPSVPAAVVHNEIFELKTNFTIINIYLVVFYVYASKHTIHIRPVEGVCFCYVLFYTHPTTYIHLFSRIYLLHILPVAARSQYFNWILKMLLFFCICYSSYICGNGSHDTGK